MAISVRYKINSLYLNNEMLKGLEIVNFLASFGRSVHRRGLASFSCSVHRRGLASFGRLYTGGGWLVLAACTQEGVG